MPTASARPPNVIILIVSPRAENRIIDANIESGIETVIISVLRQLPTNSKIISPVNTAANTPSRITSSMAAFTKSD